MRTIYSPIFLFILLVSISITSYSQEIPQNRLWIMNGFGEVKTLVAQEITIDLPGLPDVATPLTMVRIPAGTFMMGSTDSSDWSLCNQCEPLHEVTISQDFYMGKFEVTQAQWEAVMGNNPSRFSGDNRPVDLVSWNDCQDFITALNQLGQGTFRLPTEAEWEYACRAGTTTRFYFGDSDCASLGCNSCELEAYAWWCGNNGSYGTPEYGTKDVGQLLPNDFGLYDMYGNVWEWCQDWWSEDYYLSSPGVDPQGPSSGLYRVLRGGAWGGFPQNCRSANRNWFLPYNPHSSCGFRLVREVD